MSWHIGTGLEQHGHAAGVANNSPVGCCLARGSQSSGMSTKKAPPAGAPFAEPRFMQYRTGTMYVRAIRKKQRQGITMTVVSCLLCYMAHFGSIAAYAGKKGQALTYRGVLSVCGMVYLTQQIGIYKGEY